jgi:cytochrome c oxidase cbb3-type subunit 3
MKDIMKYTLLALIGAFLFIAINTNAQDGEALFKAKCSACHIMGKDGTGPNLQGVKSKWEGEEEFLYEWVVNSPKVIAEGLSERAQVVKDYSPTAMPPQDVTIDEAIAIIEYTDAWVKPVAQSDDTPGKALEVVVPDYGKNLTLFYILLIVIFLLLMAIMTVSKSTAALIKSDLFKQKIVSQSKTNAANGSKKVIGLVVGTLGFNQLSYALSFEVPMGAEKSNLWLYVENSDLYVLLIIALLLLGFLLHTVNQFFGILRMVKPKKEKAVTEETTSNIARMLTGAVPIEEEHTIDLGHDYDGIRELDNPMPPWWLAGFFLSIVFAVIYMFHYHVLGTGDLQHEEYAKEVARAEIEIQAYRDRMAMNVDETNATMMTEASDLKKGKELFINNCATCHQENGSGGVGPNITDDYWIYGNDIKDIYKVIRLGAPNGMPEHQSKFNPIQIQQVASYVLTLDYVGPNDGGKEGEGEKISQEIQDTETLTEKESVEEFEQKHIEDSVNADAVNN